MTNESEKLLGRVGIFAAAAGLAYGIYCVATYSGIYRWAAEWQMNHLGEYSVELTALCVIILPTIAPLVAMAVFLKGSPPQAGGVMSHVSTAAAVPASGEGSKGALVAVVLGLIGILVGGFALRMGNEKSKQVVSFEALDLANHSMPKTTHVELKGVVQTGMMVEFSETDNGNKTATNYMPITASDWKESEPIVFFLRPHVNVLLANNQVYKLDPNSEPFEIKLQGVLFRNDLPGPVISVYEKHGVKLAKPYMVLDTNTKADMDIYWEVGIIGGLVGLITLIIGGVMAYKNWKEAQG